MQTTINGLLLLDKPSGMTSNTALQIAKRRIGAKKAGHTGSLDPLASGLLPLCFGEATKFAHCLLEADKVYTVTMRLGVATTTGDADGAWMSVRPVHARTLVELPAVCARFLGDQWQIPPMYSALKQAGKPLYELARQGYVVERASRAIHFYDITILTVDGPWVALRVHCSKGTYIRTLVTDIGDYLGCGAHVVTLRREASGPYTLAGAVTLDALSADNGLGYVLPPEILVQHLPKQVLSFAAAAALWQGKTVSLLTLSQTSLDELALFREDGAFLGLGCVDAMGVLRAKRLLNQNLLEMTTV